MDTSNPCELNAPQSSGLKNAPATQSGDGPKLLAQLSVDGDKTKGWVTNVLLALNVVALLLVWASTRDKQTQAWLNGDEFAKFQSGAYADQRAEIKALQIEIQRIGSLCHKE
jgi:hypothetical protein